MKIVASMERLANTRQCCCHQTAQHPGDAERRQLLFQREGERTYADGRQRLQDDRDQLGEAFYFAGKVVIYGFPNRRDPLGEGRKQGPRGFEDTSQYAKEEVQSLKSELFAST